MNIVVLISGNGSNLQAIIDAGIPITAVISNRDDAIGLERAHAASIPTHILSKDEFANRDSYCTALQDLIDSSQPDLIVLAGFMLILSDSFVQHYHGKLINIHPSLLPKYKGLHTHQRALANGDSEHGASIHFVTCELDGGPVISQAKIPIHPDDTADKLKLRVQNSEHKLYPATIELIRTGRVALSQDRVVFDGKPLAKSGIMLNL